MFCGRIETIILVMCLLVFSGCAVKQPTTIKELSILKSDLGTGISTTVDYHADKNITLITLNVENSRKYPLDIWIYQSYSAEGLETIYRKRLYKTRDILTTTQVRASKLAEGVIETIKFELFDAVTGKIRVVTDSIHSDNSNMLYKSEEELIKAYPFLLDRS